MPDRPYPILMDFADQAALANLAELIPTNGKAVEIGSRLGGSAKLILEHAPPSIHLTCFDLEWLEHDDPTSYNSMKEDNAMQPLVDDWQLANYSSTWEFAKSYLSVHDNVTIVPANAPYSITDWTEPVDWVFEDSSHYNPQLIDNLNFWWNWLKPGGIMAGHDFGVQPQVDIEANALAAKYDTKLQIKNTVWWMFKPLV